MKVLGLACLLAVAGANAAAPVPHGAVVGEQDQAVRLIRTFFQAYDRHDAASVSVVFAPDARIVLPNGHLLDDPALMRDIADGNRPAVSARTLNNFEFAGSGPVMVVAFDDEEVFGGASAVIHKFRESWYLKRVPGGWRAFWVNFVPYGLDEKSPSVTRPALPGSNRPRLADLQEERAAELVERFFDGYQRHDAAALKAMFLPRAKIVHMIAVEQSVGAFARELAAHPQPHYPYPRPKPAAFDHMDFRKVAGFTLVSFDNHVRHWRDGHPGIEHVFRENWLTEETPTGPKVVWASYSIYGAAAPNLRRR